MSDTFTIEIITPDRMILNSKVSEVIIPSYEGHMGILKDHIPLITFLRPGFVKIKNVDEKKYYVEEGTVEFSNNNLLILTSTAKNLTELPNDFVERLIKNSQEKINQKDISDKEKHLLSHKIDVLKQVN